MTRTKDGSVTRRKHKKILSLAKGFVGGQSKLFRIAKQQVMKALRYAFFDRRKKKNQNKRIWILRINASTRKIRTKYNKTINLLKKSRIVINKKLLSEMPIKPSDRIYCPRLCQ